MTIRRLVTVLALACALAVVAGAPAGAKGTEIRSLTISGPGLDKPIVRKGSGGEELFLLADQMGLMRAVYAAPGSGVRPLAGVAPDVDLGPAYAVTWTVRDEGGGGFPKVRQTAYPYASRGGWVFTERGQALGGGRESGGGWSGNYYSTGLRASLVPLGLPRTSPVPVTPWSPPEPAAARAQPWGGWVPPTTLVVSVLIAAGLVVLAARRRSGQGREEVAATN
jgi:hypothetical protein